jgi:hypothetical protein
LTLADDVSGCGWGIGTYQAWGGAINEVNWGGTGFANGEYIQVVASFDPSKALGTFDPFPIPTFWMEGYLGVPNCEENIEFDLFEAFPDATAGIIDPTESVNDWTPNINCVFSGYDLPNRTASSTADFDSPDWSQMNTYGTLWIPASKNGGSYGKIERFFNGVHIPSLDVTYPDIDGHYALLDGETFGLILGAGTDDWALNVKSVTVWQTSPSDAKAGPALHR